MSSEHPVVGLKAYFAVIITLLVLTGVTVWAAFQDFGALNNVVMLAIAFFKAFLVAAIFMHLKWGARINWLFAGSGVAFFLILMAFVVADYKGRAWQTRIQPWQASAPAAGPTH